jgi:hypothetical protein
MMSPHPDQQLTKDNVLSVLALRVKLGMPVFGSDEIDDWPPGLLDDLLAEGWIRPIERARAIACDGCHDDHIEEVILIESPPGSGLRAYIPCPENGRIRVPLERLRRWEIETQKFGPATSTEIISTAIESDSPVLLSPSNPRTDTFGKWWTHEDGTFCLSTHTNHVRDGVAVFQMVNGKMTLQSRLIQALCATWPEGIQALELLNQVYELKKESVTGHPRNGMELFDNFVTLISDLKYKKLEKAGLNPEIIPSVTAGKLYRTQIFLRLAKLTPIEAPRPSRAEYQGRPDWEKEYGQLDPELLKLLDSEGEY